ncbi:MAG TPA: DUF2298 domain-containing protein, partial [Clostridia bacterium]|nr:DUF2298 domain-containing protein [Clostridia bacterium]
LIGILFLPVAQKYFSSFFDKGYGFSKVIGILALAYSSWLLTSIGVSGSGRIYAFIPVIAFIPAVFFLYSKSGTLDVIKKHSRIMLSEELLFMAMLFFWSYVRGLQPDIYGLEKYMDFGFVNAILRSGTMPPIDIWFAGKGINYYYFGHYICAYLTRLTGIEAYYTYNLMIAALFSLSFLLSFSLAANLLHLSKRYGMKKLVLAGLIAATLLSFGGNLHSFIYGYGIPLYHKLTGTVQEDPEYFYPDSTRYIGYNPQTNDKTIHEFPSYSFIVSDLHGHVSDIPTVLTFMALLLSCFAAGGDLGRPGPGKTALFGLLLSAIYMTNTWDYPIYITVFIIIMLYRNINTKQKPSNPFLKTVVVVIFITALSQIFSIPYSLKFEGISAGVGLVRYRTPLYQLAVLWGYQLLLILGFVLFLIVSARKRMRPDRRYEPSEAVAESWPYRLLRNIAIPDMICLLLCCCGLGLLLIPEVVYVSDIYYNSYHRANTMFKLTYQAFIMFCIVAGYIMVRIPSAISRKGFKILAAAGFIIIYLLPMSFFPMAAKGYYTSLHPRNYKGLDGLQFLNRKRPEDYKVIEWLNANVKGQPVILEANGESYSEYCRISMATGLPTVQGWYVHEWLWRNDSQEPKSRGEEVKTVYEAGNLAATMGILEKYKVEYIIIGDLEREKFEAIDEDKLLSFGEVVFEVGDTKVIRVKISGK